jgi:uncharacterized protein
MAAKKSARKKLPVKSATMKSATKKVAAKKAVTKKKPVVKRAAARKPAAKPAAKSVAKSVAKKTTETVTEAVTPKKPVGPGVVHWEVQAKDPVKQQTFFADLFGWAIDTNNPMNYGMVASTEGAIGGGIGQATDASRVTIYVQVPDITAALAKAESLGARTVLPRVDYGPVTMGQFSDLEGNLIGLVEG